MPLQVKWEHIDKLFRRFTIEPSEGYAAFYARAMNCIGLVPEDAAGHVVLGYVDDEKDLVTITCNLELEEAIKQATGANDILRLTTVKCEAIPEKPKVEVEKKQEQAWEDVRVTKPVHHPGIICDVCDGPINGHRFRCISCADFDVCENCEKTGVHFEHGMIRIVDPLQTVVPWGSRIHYRPHHGPQPWLPRGANHHHNRFERRQKFEKDVADAVSRLTSGFANMAVPNPPQNPGAAPAANPVNEESKKEETSARSAEHDLQKNLAQGFNRLSEIGKQVTNALAAFGVDVTYEVRNENDEVLEDSRLDALPSDEKKDEHTEKKEEPKKEVEASAPKAEEAPLTASAPAEEEIPPLVPAAPEPKFQRVQRELQEAAANLREQMSERAARKMERANEKINRVMEKQQRKDAKRAAKMEKREAANTWRMDKMLNRMEDRMLIRGSSGHGASSIVRKEVGKTPERRDSYDSWLDDDEEDEVVRMKEMGYELKPDGTPVNPDDAEKKKRKEVFEGFLAGATEAMREAPKRSVFGSTTFQAPSQNVEFGSGRQERPFTNDDMYRRGCDYYDYPRHDIGWSSSRAAEDPAWDRKFGTSSSRNNFDDRRDFGGRSGGFGGSFPFGRPPPYHSRDSSDNSFGSRRSGFGGQRGFGEKDGGFGKSRFEGGAGFGGCSTGFSEYRGFGSGGAFGDRSEDRGAFGSARGFGERRDEDNQSRRFGEGTGFGGSSFGMSGMERSARAEETARQKREEKKKAHQQSLQTEFGCCRVGSCKVPRKVDGGAVKSKANKRGDPFADLGSIDWKTMDRSIKKERAAERDEQVSIMKPGGNVKKVLIELYKRDAEEAAKKTLEDKSKETADEKLTLKEFLQESTQQQPTEEGIAQTEMVQEPNNVGTSRSTSNSSFARPDEWAVSDDSDCSDWCLENDDDYEDAPQEHPGATDAAAANVEEQEQPQALEQLARDVAAEVFASSDEFKAAEKKEEQAPTTTTGSLYPNLLESAVEQTQAVEIPVLVPVAVNDPPELVQIGLMQAADQRTETLNMLLSMGFPRRDVLRVMSQVGHDLELCVATLLEQQHGLF